MYCSKCKEKCEAEIIYSPVEYDTSEYWGYISITENQSVDVISDCCSKEIFEDKDLTIPLDPSNLPALIWR